MRILIEEEKWGEIKWYIVEAFLTGRLAVSTLFFGVRCMR
jgi:hypothetical protein